MFARPFDEEVLVTDFTAFGSMERSGWSDAKRASDYVELFALASDQTIESLLDAVGAKTGLKALDLCCGQGNVSEALISRGCHVTGIDFSPAMLAFARDRNPDGTFVEADAQNLPFSEAEFDSFRTWACVTSPINRAYSQKYGECCARAGVLR